MKKLIILIFISVSFLWSCAEPISDKQTEIIAKQCDKINGHIVINNTITFNTIKCIPNNTKLERK